MNQKVLLFLKSILQNYQLSICGTIENFVEILKLKRMINPIAALIIECVIQTNRVNMEAINTQKPRVYPEI